MNLTIETQLDELQAKIESGGYADAAAGARLWRGADVMIATEMTDEVRDWLGDQPLVVSMQELPAMRRAVITEYARELSWLFHELGGIFIDELDFVSKYDFFGGLAVQALNCLNESPVPPDCGDLLLDVLDRSRGFRSR